MNFSSLLKFPQNLFSRTTSDSADEPVSTTVAYSDDGEPHLVEMMANRRYCRILSSDDSTTIDDVTAATAWMALEENMSLVLGGVLSSGRPAAADVSGSSTSGGTSPATRGQVAVQSYYLDRYAVTNLDYARFVAAGAYSDMELWPETIWANVLQFVDATGYSGPRFWTKGRPPRNRDSHPVVGISWHEAGAYAAWAGKRLPNSAEWEQAGSWPTGCDGRGSKVRYPWGNAFDPARANTWTGGPGETIPVNEHYDGCTPNGIYQLVGNVWEWVSTPYSCSAGGNGLTVLIDQPMGEIRGGAFDTYFETQATCQFRTGQPLLYRGANVGFRCCVDAATLRKPPQPAAFL